MKTCRACLYHEFHPLGITFNESGICSGCLIHEEKDEIDWDDRLERLKKIISPYKSKTRGIHDCIVPVTGGRDSFFIVHIVKNILGLNPLLVNYNTHYSSASGVRNLSKLLTLFGADIIKSTPDPKKIKKITRSSLDLMGSIYWHCLAGHTVLPVKTASRFRIPLIIWGCHQGIDQVGMFSHLDEVEMTRRYRKDHDLMGFEAEDLINNSNLKENDLFEYFYPHDSEIEQVGIRGIYLNNYFRWDTMRQHKEMVSLYNYETRQLKTSFDNCNDIDCLHYSGLHDLIKFLKFGFSKITDHVSREIRFKRISREEGLFLRDKFTPKKIHDIEGFDAFSKWIEMDQEKIMKKINKNVDKKINKIILKNASKQNIKTKKKFNKSDFSNKLIKLSNKKKGKDDDNKNGIVISRGWHE